MQIQLKTCISEIEALQLIRTRYPVTAELMFDIVYNNAIKFRLGRGDYMLSLPLIDGDKQIHVGYNVRQASWYKQPADETTIQLRGNYADDQPVYE